MTIASRFRCAAEWALWFMHAPLAFLWLATAFIAVAAVVTLFSAPRHAMELLTLAATMAGVVKVFAHVRGIPAWPRFRAGGTTDSAVASRPDER